jgi:hypothetical protein
VSTKTTWTDLSRRAVTVVLVALCLIAVPAVASAKFTAPQTASQTVGTARMETPTGVIGGYSCKRGSQTETITVWVVSFTDNGPDGATYSYRLARGTTVADTALSGYKLVQLDGSKAKDNVATTWTLTIQATLRNWTSGTYTKSITCSATGDSSGFL